MEDIRYLATQYALQYVGKCFWNNKNVLEKDLSQPPNSLLDLKALFLLDDVFIEIISVLLNAGMAGNDILLSIYDAAVIRKSELLEREKNELKEDDING